MNPLIQFKATTHSFLIVSALMCFGLSSVAHAVVPPPDGGYPNENTAEGHQALLSLTTGVDNTAIGFEALSSNSTGSANTATGINALRNNTTGVENTANGADALISNTTGQFNTAVGFDALSSNTTGNFNTAVGGLALIKNTTGSRNTVVGDAALANNIGGDRNTATGDGALFSNTEGHDNTAVGSHALFSESTGSFDTAVGTSALESDTGIGGNSALGNSALQNNTTGFDNTAIGGDALHFNTTGTDNTAVGAAALESNTTGFENIALGRSSGVAITTGSFNIDLGNVGVVGDTNTIRVGTVFNVDLNTGQNKTFIAGIRGITTTNADAIAVVIDSAGQLGTVSSSERFKKDIGPMNKASEAILALKPVRFHYKNDTKGIPQFGLVAEDVAKVNPDLVVRDQNGEIYTVRYDVVNAMLLNEFLKEHRKVEKLEAAVAQQRKDFGATLAELKAQIQKVSAQLELNKPAPQTVVNDQ